MFNEQESRLGTGAGALSSAQVEAGLRQHMLGVYNYMMIGLAITAIVSYVMAQQVVAGTALAQALYGTSLRWVVMLAPLGLLFVMGPMANRSENVGNLRILYFVFTFLMGLSLAYVFLLYTGSDITRAFLVTVTMFGALSLFGYTTQRNLAPMGTFLFMALIGLIVASLIGLFVESTFLDMAITYGGVLIFAGLTAYDTWRIKREYYMYAEQGVMLQKASVMGAVSLYLDFLNLFLFILRIMGGNRG